MKYKIFLLLLFALPSLSAQIDSVKSYFISKDNIKHNCFLLLNKSKKLRNINQYNVIETTDSVGVYHVFTSDKINGYFLNNIYFKSFSTNYKEKMITFFAKEITSGNVILYYYNGEKMDGEPIFIFKKKENLEYDFVHKNIQKEAKETAKYSHHPPQDNSTSSSTEITKFYDEIPYLEYFKNYLSNCSLVLTKFKSDWYTFESIETMFKDYNKCK